MHLQDVTYTRGLLETFNGHTALSDWGERCLEGAHRELRKVSMNSVSQVHPDFTLAQMQAYTETMSELYPRLTFSIGDDCLTGTIGEVEEFVHGLVERGELDVKQIVSKAEAFQEQLIIDRITQ